MDTIYLLVLGTPRSGTTLLAAMIGRHTEVAMVNENFGWAVRNLVGKHVAGNKLTVPNQIELSERGSGWCRRLQRRFGVFPYRPQGSLSIGDYIDWDAKLIGTLRDGNAVISSIMKRGEVSYKLAAYRWRRGVEVLYELNRQCPDRLLLFPFDHLVGDSERAMRAVAEHLEMPYQKRMLDGYAYTPQYDNESIDASKAKEKKEDFELEDRYPEVCEKYTELLQQCAERSNAPAPSS